MLLLVQGPEFSKLRTTFIQHRHCTLHSVLEGPWCLALSLACTWSLSVQAMVGRDSCVCLGHGLLASYFPPDLVLPCEIQALRCHISSGGWKHWKPLSIKPPWSSMLSSRGTISYPFWNLAFLPSILVLLILLLTISSACPQGKSHVSHSCLQSRWGFSLLCSVHKLTFCPQQSYERGAIIELTVVTS